MSRPGHISVRLDAADRASLESLAAALGTDYSTTLRMLIRAETRAKERHQELGELRDLLLRAFTQQGKDTRALIAEAAAKQTTNLKALADWLQTRLPGGPK